MPGEASEPFDAVIVGAGFAGLYMLHKLRQMQMRAVVLEAAGGVGGTWYWNRYPGARCDVESLEYSYSFDESLQQQWQWSERYARQPEILRYLEHVADRFDLRRDIVLNTRVVGASWDEGDGGWLTRARDQQGGVEQSYRSRFLITAVGCLSLPSLPPFAGLDTFRGKIYHTGQWPHHAVDFTGQRVAVIGTGSSGIQAIPEIAKQAAHLTVFQRTPNFSLPAKNAALTPDVVGPYKARYAEHRETARHSQVGIAGYPVPTRSALEVPEDERTRIYEAGWERGNTSFTRLFTDIVKSEAANATAAGFVRGKIRSIVADPSVAEKLLPTSFIGTKRLCLDAGYFEAFNRPNVSLVDVNETPITGFSSSAIRTTRQDLPIDAVVFATGYDAVTGALFGLDIRNGRGERLADKWEAGPRTYLGLMTAGFPNLLMITGPGSPSILANVVTAIEQHVEWLAACLSYMREHRRVRIDVGESCQDDWVGRVNAAAEQTLLTRANSWYMGANIPGKPRVFLPYCGGMGTYRAICDQVAAEGYAGFEFA